MYNLLIQNEKEVFQPEVVDPVSIEWNRKGSAGKIDFTVPKLATASFHEGNQIAFKVGSNDIFLGYVWTKERTKDDLIKVTCYDQLKYLTYKDTFLYLNKKASDVIQMIANDQHLKVGEVSDTKYVIQKRLMDNSTFFDIIYDALDLTFDNTNIVYTLFDSYGRLTLKSIQEMRLDIVIDEDVSEDFDYKSTLEGTYNTVKLIKENKKTGQRDIFIEKNDTNIKKWGKLQYFDIVDEETDGKTKAKTLLKAYNKVNRSLNIKNVLGDIRVRAGSLVFCNLHLGDMVLKQFMLVDKVVHNFSHNAHFMDLSVKGGVI